MSRQSPLLGTVATWAMIVLVGLSGCQPQQPFYLFEDGDLSHYLDVATEIDYPDVEEETLADVDGAIRPFSLRNSDPKEVWDLPLEEAIQCALANSKVMRSIGGQILGMPDHLVRNPASTGDTGVVATVYDPAVTEANPRFGTEAALSAFDAQFSTSVFWEKNDAPRNPLVFPGSEDVFPRQAKEDLGTFQAQLAKTAATGGTWILRHNVAYSKQNTSRLFTSDWNTNVEAEFRQPLLQGAGVQFNRIAGPGAIPGFNNGVMIARINHDIALAEFEAGVRNLVNDVEVAYWELYFAYRSLDAVIAGRDSGLQTWRQTDVELKVGTAGAHEEAQARQQYFLFEGAMEQALHSLYAAESKLRYMMGLGATDGRLIRPADEPATAKIDFDWCECHAEALARSVELRQHRWIVKQRELELISAKNYLLPRLDAVGRYRWLGLGDDLLGNAAATGTQFDNAYQSMTTGDFQEWQLGLDLTIPIGFRKEMSGVRYAQLRLARERSRLQETELEASHQLAYAIRELEGHWENIQTNFDRRIAARDEVKTAEAKLEAGVTGGTLDRVLDAQRRLAEAESDYYRSLIDYNISIAQVHFRKGSLLEYDGVYLTEGPWPGKAYFDSQRRARARDASFYLDYGFTRPKVISRGAYEQEAGRGSLPLMDEVIETQAPGPEQIPTPAGEPIAPTDDSFEPSLPEPPEPDTDNQAGTSQAAPWIAVKKTTRGGRTRELGFLNLDELADNPVEKGRTAAARQSAVRTAGYEEEAATRSGSDEPTDGKPNRTSTKSTQSGWVSSKRSGTRYESVANSSAAETDRSASGWKRVQR